MRWLKSLRNKQLEPSWQFKTEGVLWRLLSSDNGLFVGEDRNLDSKSVSFFCIEQASGRVRWKNVHFKERWWISIESMHRNVLFLHEYASPDMPDHKKIYAVELGTGKLMWMNDELKFLFAYKDSVYTAKDEYSNRTFFELDLTGGTVVREIDPSYLNVLRNSVATNIEAIEYPRCYDVNQGDTLTVKKKIETVIADTQSIMHAEYIDKNTALIIGYYENKSASSTAQDLQQHIVMVDQGNNRILFRDVIHSHVASIVPDIFFCIGDFVYYIKDRKLLIAVKLLSNPRSNDQN